MVIAQIALSTPHREALFSNPFFHLFFTLQNGLKAILASILTLHPPLPSLKQDIAPLDVKKSAPNNPGKPLQTSPPPPPPFRQCPYGNNTFQKGASPKPS